MAQARKRRIAIVTGSRAEYGLLSSLMKRLVSSADLELQVVVTGMHLSETYGMTVHQIEADGYEIAARVPMLETGDDGLAMARSVSRGVLGCAEAFEKLRPDLVVVLGDRFEILAAAQAAMLMKIPIAHIHGGEITEGAIDESIRHAITKMAHLHFVSAEEHFNRVVQMGEQPAHVFNFGAPGLDAISELKVMTRDEIEKSLGVKLTQHAALVTFHPETLSDTPIDRQMDEVFAALEKFPDLQLLFTKPNADSGGIAIAARIDKFVEKSSGDTSKRAAFTSLGQSRYLNLLREVSVVIGNSSSGLIEAPALQKPTVNIGDRQKGRLSGETVFDCQTERGAIEKSIRAALSDSTKSKTAKAKSPYGLPGASEKIAMVLATVRLEDLRRKPFHDLESQK
jgi:UDP-hydrolysing UDP-N-acetyl-D-glucosamine 2-epimerase